MAGNAEVQQRTVDLVDAQLFQRLSSIAEVDLHHRGGQSGQTRPRSLHSVRVLIQRDQPSALFRVQSKGNLAGMSCPSCRAVEICPCRVDGKSVQTLVQEHRDMLKRGRVKCWLCQFIFHKAQPPFYRFRSYHPAYLHCFPHFLSLSAAQRGARRLYSPLIQFYCNKTALRMQGFSLRFFPQNVPKKAPASRRFCLQGPIGFQDKLQTHAITGVCGGFGAGSRGRS